MYQQDFIKRQIQLFAEAIAKIAGLRSQGQLEQAMTQLKQAYRALGVSRDLLALDNASLVALLRAPEKLTALAELLEEEARLVDASSSSSAATATSAAALRQRASEIRKARDALPASP